MTTDYAAISKPSAPPPDAGAVSARTPWRVALRKYWMLYLMLVPAFILLLVFSYYPLWGISLAFVKFNPFKGISGSEFVGFKHFNRILSSKFAWPLLRNTVSIAISKIIASQVASILFALMLDQVRQRIFKRSVQTLTTFPHFLSWVVVGGIMLDMFSGSGLVNQAIMGLGLDKVNFFGEPFIFRLLVIFSDTWKGFGFGAVVYLAALAAINPELYEAAAVDGAGRFQRIWHITLPSIRPTIILMACLALGNVLNAGFGQILILSNDIVLTSTDIIDTYVYRVGLVQRNFSLGTAVGLMKSVVGFFLITLSYWLADRFADYRIF